MTPITGTIFILLSIKTRIETLRAESRERRAIPFLSYYPLKQGLKLEEIDFMRKWMEIFILLSIKTRIETEFRVKS